MTVDLAHDVTGRADAPVVVLLGSLGTDRTVWDPQLGPLAEHLRVLRVELRGNGASPAPEGPYTMAELGGDVLALLDRLELPRAHLVGLSLGGMVTQWIAAHSPERVHTLSLLSTSAHFDEPQAWRQRAATVRQSGCAELAPTVVQRWFTPELAQRDPALVRRYVAMVGATDPQGYAGCAEAIAGWDGRADLGRITARTLVVAGADDHATPPSHLETIADGVADAHLHVLTRAAHLCSVEQAGAVTQLLLDQLVGEHAGRAQAHAVGLRVRREVLGAAQVDSAMEATTEFSAPFQDFLTRVAWGDVWHRPGLSRATRSAVTLAALTALGSEAGAGRARAGGAAQRAVLGGDCRGAAADGRLRRTAPWQPRLRGSTECDHRYCRLIHGACAYRCGARAAEVRK